MRALLLALGVAALAGCGDDGIAALDGGVTDAALDAPVDAAPPSWPFALPANFPVPRLPPDQRLTAELAELGRYLFYDVRLSANGTQACGSCHLQARAFADGKVTPSGSTGTVLRRNAMGLTNVAYNPSYTWASPVTRTLEAQALIPMFGKHPVELGISGHEPEILARLAADSGYVARFAAAFPGEVSPIGFGNVARALAAFQRRLISGGARVDRYRQGDLTALTDAEVRGQALFFSEVLECHHCHGGFNFTIATDHAGLPSQEPHFFNTGLYASYPADDPGLWEFTFLEADRGRFRPPTLRNVALTAPYMHDGSVATLEEVVDIYARGGRLIVDGPNAGDGRTNPNKSPLVNGFTITATERADLLAFLRALTDDAFVADPTLADPFAPPPAAAEGP
ncbi:MAG: di-heme enzyme [Myxococcales bacterium]|nr:di-heme enzyme [Myxococcales bacterium]MBK7192516.1 di-heme enzyme [Myxococcales bacterium]MBP6842877.1 di-heme enzyme [Kofleriaceae bacterium]